MNHPGLTSVAAMAAMSATAVLGQSHVGSSPFDPPEKSDITFVVDQAPGLDTGCTYRGGGPLRFSVKTTRFIGETNADGTLKDAAKLVAEGVIGATAKLSMPGFDVDDTATPPPPFLPERNTVFFNGQQIGVMRGVNNSWLMNSFDIPIERVKFPSRGANGVAPTPVNNDIVIHIDTANSAEVWCTAVDWASLGIKALSPLVLVHGNNSNGGFFERQGFTATLRSRGIPFDNSISMPTETIAAHSARLKDLIPAIAKSFGVDSIHMVAHSKGGLDSRDYLAKYQPSHDKTFTVLSLTTLSTPHDGSVLADLKVDYDAAVAAGSAVKLSGFPFVTSNVLSQTGSDAGTPNLTTGFVAGFNTTNLAQLAGATVFHTISADADTNGNREMDLSPDEYAELRAESTALQNVHNGTFGHTKSRWVIDAMYQILRNTASVTVVTRTSTPLFGQATTTATLTSVDTAQALGNDTLVTIPSGEGAGGFTAKVSERQTLNGAQGRNHSNVANAGVASTVLPWIFKVEKNKGDLR